MGHPRTHNKEGADSIPADGGGGADRKRRSRPSADDELHKGSTLGPPPKKPSYPHQPPHSPTPRRATSVFLATLLRRSHTPGTPRSSADQATGIGFNLGGVNSNVGEHRIEFMPYDATPRSNMTSHQFGRSARRAKTPGPGPQSAIGYEPLLPKRQTQPWTNIGDDAQDLLAQEMFPTAGIPEHSTQTSASLNHQSVSGGRTRVNSHHAPPAGAGDNRTLVQAGGQRTFDGSDQMDGGVELFDDIVSGMGRGQQGSAHPDKQVIFSAFSNHWTALGSRSLQDIWNSVQEQCKYDEIFALNDVKEIVDSHRCSMETSLQGLATFTEHSAQERQQLVAKAQGVLKRMRRKTEKYDDARQKVISSVAQRPPKHKFCTLL